MLCSATEKEMLKYVCERYNTALRLPCQFKQMRTHLLKHRKSMLTKHGLTLPRAAEYS